MKETLHQFPILHCFHKTNALFCSFNLPNYTIEVKLKTNSSNDGAIISKSVGADAASSSWKIMQANGIVKVGVDGDASVPTITGNNIADNNWHTVTAQNTG